MRVAALDIGSNTVRLLIADVLEGAARQVVRRSTVIRLARGVDATGRLDPDAVAQSLAVVAGYAAAAERAGCDRIGVVATSAVRDAANRAELTDQVQETTGVVPIVLSGAEEAALSFAGAVTGGLGDPPYLVVDLGGGSTEIVAGTDHVESAVSVDIGSVRLTERMLPDRPASPVQVLAARRHVAELFASEAPVGPAGRTTIGVGGTFTSLAALYLGLPAYDPDRVQGAVVPIDGLDSMVDDLARLDLAATEAIPSLDPARAPVLLGGAVVAAVVLRHVGAATVTVSEHDILDGLAVALAEGTM